MNIGYSVQGSTDRAFLVGLKTRWCPDANLIEGRFRGSTRDSLRREYRKICAEFQEKSVDVMVFLTDADTGEWREVQKNERAKFPAEHLNRAIHGVAQRNVECWICAAPEWLAKKLDVAVDAFRAHDPKKAFEQALEIDRDDRKEAEIAALVCQAPLKDWLTNPSFDDFYEQARDLSQQFGCLIENLREAQKK